MSSHVFALNLESEKDGFGPTGSPVVLRVFITNVSPQPQCTLGLWISLNGQRVLKVEQGEEGALVPGESLSVVIDAPCVTQHDVSRGVISFLALLRRGHCEVLSGPALLTLRYQVPQIKLQFASYLEEKGRVTRISFNATNYSDQDLQAEQVALIFDTDRFGTPAHAAAATLKWLSSGKWSQRFRVVARPSGLPGTADNLFLIFTETWASGTTIKGAFEYCNPHNLKVCVFYPMNGWISQLINEPSCPSSCGDPQPRLLQRILATHRDWSQVMTDTCPGNFTCPPPPPVPCPLPPPRPCPPCFQQEICDSSELVIDSDSSSENCESDQTPIIEIPVVTHNGWRYLAGQPLTRI